MWRVEREVLIPNERGLIVFVFFGGETKPTKREEGDII